SSLQVDEHQRAPEDRVDVEVLQQRQEDRHEDDDDLGPLERPAQHEDDRLRQDHELHGCQVNDSTQCSTSCWPPGSAKTAEKSAEPTKSQQTIAIVLAVRNTDCLMRSQSSDGMRRSPATRTCCAGTQPGTCGS